MISRSNRALKLFAAVILLSTGFAVGPCDAQSESLIKDIRFQSEVTAGEPAHIEIEVADEYLGTAIFQFGSEQQGPYRLVRFSGQASGETVEGSISEQVGRKIVIDVDSSTDPKAGTTCWLRVNGTNGCELRMLQADGSIEKVWVNASKNKGTWRWVRVDALEGKDTTKISFLVPPNSDCILDCVAFSKDPDFNPEGILGDANKFNWRTNSSSVGKHTFAVSVKANDKIDSRNIVINVLPEKKKRK